MKHFNKISMFLERKCVCVCVREREREREMYLMALSVAGITRGRWQVDEYEYPTLVE
jgi:hypothetical protein